MNYTSDGVTGVGEGECVMIIKLLLTTNTPIYVNMDNVKYFYVDDTGVPCLHFIDDDVLYVEEKLSVIFERSQKEPPNE